MSMTPSERDLMRTLSIQNEGLRYSAYQDSLGFWTIGIGRLIDGRRGGRLSPDEVIYLYEHDLDDVLADLSTFSWFAPLSPVRQRAVCDLRFQLGPAGLRDFHQMIDALTWGNLPSAAQHLRHSKLGREQAPQRTAQTAQMLETGIA